MASIRGHRDKTEPLIFQIPSPRTHVRGAQLNLRQRSSAVRTNELRFMLEVLAAAAYTSFSLLLCHGKAYTGQSNKILIFLSCICFFYLPFYVIMQGSTIACHRCTIHAVVFQDASQYATDTSVQIKVETQDVILPSRDKRSPALLQPVLSRCVATWIPFY